MSRTSHTRRSAWLKRKRRVRKKVVGTAQKPRLTVFRSHQHIYAQIVDDEHRRTLVWCDSRKSEAGDVPEGIGGKCASAYRVGKTIAGLAKQNGVAQIVFDRNGYLYHGRVEALARGARDGGLEF
jgi:large subunit ribosomal protein L18